MRERKLKLNVGLEIVVKSVLTKEEIRLIGTVLGWEKDNLIIIKLKDRTNVQYFANGRSILVGFVNEGVVYGFNSKVIMNIVIKGLSLFIFEYPEKLEVFPLRKEERIAVFINGTFSLVNAKKQASYDCEIKDINNGGCAITTSKELPGGENILLSFSIPTQGEIKDLRGEIVNVREQEEDEFGYGIKFNGDENQIKIISGFKIFVDKVTRLIRVESPV